LIGGTPCPLRFQVILQGFAADGDAVFDDKRDFNRAERIALNGIPFVGKPDVVMVPEFGERLRRQGPQSG